MAFDRKTRRVYTVTANFGPAPSPTPDRPHPASRHPARLICGARIGKIKSSGYLESRILNLRRFIGGIGMRTMPCKFAAGTTAALLLRAGLLLFLFLFVVQLCPAYSVLTHEEIVDLLWKDQIQPLLKKRFPDATEEDLRKAHAYAYGGSLVQDMGYYPFGNKHFSDLLHYVRSGDFTVILIQESSDLNEFAFALGALSHYSADNSGHPTINRVVTIEFPKLAKKFGERATYADGPKAHIRTEFGFDMVQVAKNRYTSDRYHDFIGFEVSKELLDRAFLKTYGLKLDDVFGSTDLAIGTFRRSISIVIPEMTRVALLDGSNRSSPIRPNFNKKKFLYYLSRKNYEKEWGKGYRKPGCGTRILAFFLRLMPKVGPFSALAFKIPDSAHGRHVHQECRFDGRGLQQVAA